MNVRNFSIIKFPTRLQKYMHGCEKNCLTSNDRFHVQNASIINVLHYSQGRPQEGTALGGYLSHLLQLIKYH